MIVFPLHKKRTKKKKQGHEITPHVSLSLVGIILAMEIGSVHFLNDALTYLGPDRGKPYNLRTEGYML